MRLGVSEYLRFVLVALLLCCGITSSCTDSGVVSDNPSHKVEFSSDTISFDTVFTSIGSATREFLVYNNNDVDIEATVSLAGGSSSPFRINVDGMSGTSIPDVLIRANDSVFCFVSVTVNPHDSDAPVLEMDSVRFILSGGSVQNVRLMAYGQDVIRLDNQRIQKNTLFTGNRPYLIFDTLFIAKDAVLAIDKGSRLYFHDNAVLRVAGRIRALGTPDSMIVMRGDRLDNMLSDIPYDLVSGRWGGILLDSCSFDNVFQSCDIHGAVWGIKTDRSSLKREKLFINGSIIHNVKENCLMLDFCKGRVYNSQITNAGGHCVSLLGGDVDFIYCTIANFYPWAEKKSALDISNTQDSIILPLVRTTFTNCIVTGSGDDELTGLVADSIQGYSPDEISNYRISSSLVLTVDTVNPHLKGNVWELDGHEVYGARNFRHVAQGDYYYDFSLDSLSRAIGIAVPTSLCPFDMNGVIRPDSAADAGCLQYVKP